MPPLPQSPFSLSFRHSSSSQEDEYIILRQYSEFTLGLHLRVLPSWNCFMCLHLYRIEQKHVTADKVPCPPAPAPLLHRMPSDLWASYGLCSFFSPRIPHIWNYIVCQLPILTLLIKVHFRTPYWVLPFLIEWAMVIPAMKFISHNFQKGAWEEHFLSPRIPVHVNVLSSHLTDNVHWHSILKWWHVPSVLWMHYPVSFSS